MIKRVLKVLGLIVIGFILFVGLYFGAAWVLSRIGVGRERDTKAEVTIYIKTNGVHTDIVVPVRTGQRDWSQMIPFSNTRGKDTTAPYVGLGWGDRGFYLETPTWGDLKFSTAFKAAFGLSRTAVHATFYKAVQENKSCVRIDISKEQYGRLISYIDGTFKTDSSGKPIVIPTTAVYSGADAFYEAKGKYSLFRTCNGWSNGALKRAGQKAAVWAPFDWGIFYQYAL